MIIPRLASEEDNHDLFKWRNDPLTLKSFFNQEIVKQEDHEKWFRKVLISKKSTLIILEKNQKKLGMVRYDEKDSLLYVSLNTNPDQRGKGYASKMLLSSEKFINRKNKPIKIIADILIENEISMRTFHRAGYNLEEKREFFFRYIKLISNSE